MPLGGNWTAPLKLDKICISVQPGKLVHELLYPAPWAS